MEKIYLNNAATSWPKAPGVAEAVAAKLLEMPLHAGRIGFTAEDSVARCRGLLAEMLHTSESERIVLCNNATHALNIALHGFPWKEGAVVLTTVAEHNSVLRPLFHLRKSRGLRIEMLPVDHSGQVSPELWQRAIKRHSPQLVIVSHASNVTGAVQPIIELCSMAKQAGAFTLLDASQTAGLIELFPEPCGVDLLAFTGHKYLLGPPGTGGLYIGPGIDLEPIWAGGTGVMSDLDEMPPNLPTRFEPGTLNEPAFIGLAHALRWRKDNPLEHAALLRQTGIMAEGLQDLGAQVIRATPQTPVISFTVPGWDPEEIGEILYQSFGIVCRTGLHCAPKIHGYLATGNRGTVRLSLSRFTTDAELEYTLTAMRRILA